MVGHDKALSGVCLQKSCYMLLRLGVGHPILDIVFGSGVQPFSSSSDRIQNLELWCYHPLPVHTGSGALRSSYLIEVPARAVIQGVATNFEFHVNGSRTDLASGSG